MNKLKNCPFCGDEPELKNIHLIPTKHNDPEYGWEIRCPWCGVGTDASFDINEVLSVWNKRSYKEETK